jgi:predicted ATPase
VYVTLPVGLEVVEPVIQHLRETIHVPAWRGDPKRSYPATAVDRAFPGTFDRYVASVIAQWRTRADQRHRQAEEDLAGLGLTSELSAEPLDETQLELLVGRLPGRRGQPTDLVNIADVGFGVSQCLPVVIAMLTAAPGQLVYVEEPEIHLHPRAQVALAQLAVRAAKRRVRVVLETHSSLLLRGIQTAVARSEIAADQVALHWFERSESGATRVRTADLAHDGSFGEWPVDFDEVALAAERDYLDAS